MLRYVTCSRGGGRTIMTLKWPERRRRIEQFESVERALSHEHRSFLVLFVCAVFLVRIR
jgi:hypothetical protein